MEGIRGAGPSFCGSAGEICGVALSCGLVELETAACAKTDAAMANNEAAIKKNLPVILRLEYRDGSPQISRFRYSFELRHSSFVISPARKLDSVPNVFRFLQPMRPSAQNSLPLGRARFFPPRNISRPGARNKVRLHSRPDASRTIQ